MNVHDRCPACDTSGSVAEAQGEHVIVCTNGGCRVYTYENYYG